MGLKLAHIAEDGREQSVYKHLKNVMEYCGIYASKIGLESCGKLAGVLHDIGKFSDDFCKHITSANREAGYNKKGPDHSTAGAVYILSLIDQFSSKQSQITAQIIAMTIMWHHGGLKDICDYLGDSQYLNRIKKYDDVQWKKIYEHVKGEFHNCFSEEYVGSLFSEASREISCVLNRIESMLSMKADEKDRWESERQFCYGLLCKFLYSCLIDADRYDTMTFCDDKEMEPPADNKALWHELSSRFEEKYNSLNRDSEINTLRSKLSDNCLKSSERIPGVYTLNCPTGSGKTLSSLRYALNHAEGSTKEHIFYIIPFISVIEQNSEVIKDFLKENDFSDKSINLEKIIFELHSAVDIESEDNCGDKTDLKEMELLAERMDAPLVITTMVRFLNTFFKSGTRNPRPIHNFANSIIIFDEIQAIPINCIGMFNSLINFLVSVCNATVILSTATQIVLDHSHGKEPALVISPEQEISGCTDDIREKFKRVEFVTDLLPEPQDPPNTLDAVAEEISKTAKLDNSILVVLNTKSSARLLYDYIKKMKENDVIDDGFSIYYLSTGLCPAHRSDKLAEIRQKLTDNEKLIIVSTQLIEAGVDVSFQTVFRSLAGLDSIIQAAGRCNREGKYNDGKVILFEPDRDFENLDYLSSIKNGRDATKQLLRVYRKRPERFGGRIDSPEAIAFYFNLYLGRKADILNYPFTVRETGNTEYMYSILADNKKYAMNTRRAILEFANKGWAPQLKQSFALAGYNFEAIETIGIPVIVPYGEGQKITEALSSAAKFEEKRKLLKIAQKYCININVYHKSMISDYADFYDDIGIYILKNQHYDEAIGFIEEAKLEPLVY